ncbi:chromosomal replication initiation protein [Ligilactobacillus hayakitensis DSM 18933 = JCM 14209]|uniref:Chromosomal replication initiator protein DnaA n=1 Tax=Ligilactobacillus hayakitensis DSM 18933 = JCM 14209 TaxID=1423755 RepID=A0A0R1WNR1_9LACO|nr:chromosomal replication initiator protein DnaA [Ligilactobacillus hayakitensis]KRM19530.1 chromosomal replication initiation protein [Ligilactobacillus hayakitensis DSM 18933 = JCM 14209]
MHDFDLDSLWQYILESFNKSLSQASFKAWFESADPVQYTDQTLIVNVPTVLHRDYWTQKLSGQITDMIKNAGGPTITVLAKLPEDPNPLAESDPVDDKLNSKKDTTNNVDATTVDFTRGSQLNERYTFDTFVVGKGNQFAHAAALGVAEEPGNFYNPLFFYGGVGLGKTHLMHAIGHHMLQNNPNAKVKYVTSETFANDFINSIQKKRQEEFRREYRNVDLLLVDDIQFFADKLGTQEEFFHTFNTLYDEKKQIVLSADRLPNEIKNLQERLVSRFKWGLSVDITPPDFETRIAILRNKAEAEHVTIPDDTLSYIAGQIDSNIRELEGALMRVEAFSSMTKTPISVNLASEALKNLKINNKANALTIPIIQDFVSKYYHVSVADLKGKKRTKSIVRPRQVAMYLSRELTGSSLPKIGSEFGGKDHSTVIHAHEKISKALPNDSDLQREINELRAELKH